MSVLDGLRHRLYVLVRGESYAREIERELRFHLELGSQTRETQDAEIAARRRLGNLTYYREEVRRMTLVDFTDHIRQDLRYAWRGVRRSPGFSTAVVVTIALGIGANASMFALLDRVFVQAPAGVTRPDQLRRLYIETPRVAEPNGRLVSDNIKYPQFRAIAAADTSADIAAFTEPDSTALIVGDARIPVRRSLVTGSYFSTLGVKPQLGRFLVGEEHRIESPTPVAILGDAIWRRVFNADRAVIGRQISINFKPYTVIGVAPEEFRGLDLDAVDLWVPANTYSTGPTPVPWYETFRNRFAIVARITSASTEERLLVRGTAAARAVRMSRYPVDSMMKLVSGPIVRAAGPARQTRELAVSTRIAGVAIIVLVIAVANVANLLLVRASRRRREIGVRRAIGASDARLYAQLMTESILLAVVGSIAAVVVAYWGANALRRLLLPRVQWADGALDMRTLVFVGLSAIVVGVVAGLAPALSARDGDLTAALKAGGSEGGYRRSRLRAVLLVAQAALCVVLLVGASLFVKTLDNVRDIDLGFDAERALYAYPVFANTPIDAREKGIGIGEVAQRLAGAPGVEAVAYGEAAPIGTYAVDVVFLPDRDSVPRIHREGLPSYYAISADYVRATGMRLIQGREFTRADQQSGARVVLVGETLARTYWPGRPAVGQCLILGARSNPCSIVVGVVADVKRLTLIENPVGQYYVPITDANIEQASTLLVRIRPGAFGAVSRLVSEELRRRFPALTASVATTRARSLEDQFRPWKLGATLFAMFSILALAVAAVGVYSVVAFAVSQRSHEMGVRVALGARGSDIIDLVVGESMRTIAVGIVVGLIVALLLGRVVASLLFGVTTRDPSAFLIACAVLCGVGMLASYIPAWRASRVDPVSSLRAD
jgi:predicted permease